MPPRRRTHTKSRNGCLSCKKRHTKCDEAGPPCLNCVAKNLSCIYGKPEDDPIVTGSVGANEEAITFNSIFEQAVAEPSSSQPITISPAQRLLELELMHRWCTSTGKSLCVNDELEMLQTAAPQEALKHEFLLNGIFSISALDIAMNVKPSESTFYVNSALEYYNKASVEYRSQLSRMDSENSLALVLSGILIIVLSIALPVHVHPENSMLENILLFFGMIIGAQSVAESNAESILSFQDDLAKIEEPFRNESHLNSLDENTLAAIQRQNSINDEYYNQTNSDSRQMQWEAITSHSACRKAIFQLEECFMHCTDPNRTGIVILWPAIADKDFVDALQETNPVALLVLMHWASLVESSCKEFWYLKSVGGKLTAELSKTIPQNLSPAWKDAISWARNYSGLL